MNVCNFSPCRKYRFTLEHTIHAPDLVDPALAIRRIMWIGLNPSTADEQKLDPTLRRIRAFSKAWGFTSFVMTNLFAFRATQPKDMLAEPDPVGAFTNDLWLTDTASKCHQVVACWGTHGSHLHRDLVVMKLLGVERLCCLGLNQDGSPKHPLYVSANTAPVPFQLAA